MRQLEQDRLDLPALPTVAARTIQVVGHPEYRVEEVTELIESDPLLAARLIRLVNNAAFAGRQPIESIRECVTRLGTAELRNFLVETAAAQVLDSRDPRIAALCRGLWEHSIAVAVLTREILRLAGSADAELGYLAGLLHDVGKPLMAGLLVSAEQRLLGQRTSVWMPSEQWLRFIVAKHRAIGMALARTWELPAVVGRGIADSAEYDLDEPTSVANAVRFGNAVAKLNGLYVGQFDRDDVQALGFVGQQLFSITGDHVDRLVASLGDEVRRRTL
jgi:putative nucleotidyltransferase with HDIG domain